MSFFFDLDLPATVLKIKQLINAKLGIPVDIQNLYDFYSVSNDAGFLPFADDFIFKAGAVAHIRLSCVLTVGLVEPLVNP